MIRAPGILRRIIASLIAPRPQAFLLVAGLVACTGCYTRPADPKKVEMPSLPPKEVAEFLKGTIWQYSDLTNSEPMRVSGYGLVVNLSGTGDTRAPNTVREYMVKEMQKHGFGNPVQIGFERLGPEQVLNDRLGRTAIVRVDGFIPPGARKNQPFDVQVSALENNNTTSLHRGVLYSTDLGPRGADPMSPGAASISLWANASGPIFVNPSFALDDSGATAAQKLSLRTGIVMGRGIAVADRPLVLKLRQPEKRMARMIERRIQERFQDSKIASAQNESEIWVYVPKSYGDDWEHFAGLITHLYFTPSNDFAILKGRQLAEIAKKELENAPLFDITYCWEGFGPAVLPEIRPLYLHENPDVAYAAARAGAFLGDLAAEEALFKFARDKSNPFQLTSVRVLGQLPRTARVAGLLHELIDTDQNLLRVEAYRAMTAVGDASIVSEPIQEKFILDIVPSKGPPFVYASRVGTPRIAVIGRRAQLAMPILFLAMQGRFSISHDTAKNNLKLFYRGEPTLPEVLVESQPDLAIVIARLGGAGPTQEGGRFNFSYGDVVALLQRLSEQKLIVVSDPSARKASDPVAFQLQTVPGIEDPILSAPPIPENNQQRPTTAPALSGPGEYPANIGQNGQSATR
ncbi:MAG: flagellar basal body P-ring protein FlgI [Burkholderiales bacterium]|nr:flagellar basal body P-ring protein FlgI [Phycisphaerae bacterium]